MTGRPGQVNPAARLAARLAAGQQVGRAGAYPRAIIVPVLDDDPDPSDPTNMWLFDDGRLRLRGSDGTVHEYVPSNQSPIQTLAAAPAASTNINVWVGTDGVLHVRQADGTVLNYSPDAAHTSTAGGGSGSGSTTKPRQANSQPTTHRRTWSATWGRIICPAHGVETGGNLHYGRYSSVHGRRRIMLGFDDADIRAQLAGSTIQRVELHMRNTDAYLHSGVQVYFGGHDRSSAPGSYSSVRERVFSAHWPENGSGSYWRGGGGDILWFGRKLRDNVIKGLTVAQPSDSVVYYGELDWSSVQLRITYSK